MQIQRIGWVLAVCVAIGSSAHAQAQSSAPGAVEAVAVGTSEVRVYWNAAQGATGYVIYRDDQEIGRVGGEAKAYTDRSAEPGRTYRYNVGAIAADGAIARGRAYLERAYSPVPARTECDLLVVGATTGGVATAVTAARYGVKVVLIEETRRLGGMPVNGLGTTDLRRIADSSGLFEEFRRTVQRLYGTGDGLRYEPRVAQQAIKEMLWSAPGLTVYREVRPVKVATRDGRITRVDAEEVRTGRRVTFLPKLVVDATDCGDVAAWAGAPYRLGREPRSPREPHAGHIYYDRATDRPLPGSTGRGDRRIQAYAYLMTVQDFGPGADKTIPKPPGYDPAKYEHAGRWETSWAVTSGRLPNKKFEVNQHPQGSDLQVVNYPYPTASYAERRKIEEAFKNHALGYLYYIQTVQGHKNIGLSEDDYRDSDNWPSLLYIREARRFEADRVLDETDISDARKLIRPNVIGIGDYPMDSHAVEPKTDWTTPDMGEGEFYLPQYTPWHQVPYSAMVPQRVDNLLVPTAVSATHVAYGTLRLEPVRMHFGEAAGVAAYLCLQSGLMPREIPARQIQNEITKREVGTPGRSAKEGIGAPGPSADPAYLYLYNDVNPTSRKYREIEWLAARGFFPVPEAPIRSASSGVALYPFSPNESLTVARAMPLLGMVARRDLEGKRDVGAAFAGFDAGEVLTRGMAAVALARFMGWKPVGPARYADLTPGSPVAEAGEALRAHWIDSVLWDTEKAFAPDGRLIFRPDTPLTRAQYAQLLYLACIHFGPLWYDHPADRQSFAL